MARPIANVFASGQPQERRSESNIIFPDIVPLKPPLMLLFLDFDGVLHPDEVYMIRGRPTLRAEGSLFMWVDVLEKTLSPYPQIEIVLATSWVRWRSYSRTCKALPEVLRTRIVGATWHSRMDPREWAELTRYQQIRRYLRRRHNVEWLALDDDDEGWGHADINRLICTDPEQGISNPETQWRLQMALAKFA